MTLSLEMSYPPKNRKNKFCPTGSDTSHWPVSEYPSAISRGAPVRSVLYDNLKRNCSKFSEATLFVSIPPYPCCNPALPVAAGARGDGVAKQIDLGPRWEPGPPPERSAACLQRAALRVVPEQQSIHIPPALPSSRCECAVLTRSVLC